MNAYLLEPKGSFDLSVKKSNGRWRLAGWAEHPISCRMMALRCREMFLWWIWRGKVTLCLQIWKLKRSSVFNRTHLTRVECLRRHRPTIAGGRERFFCAAKFSISERCVFFFAVKPNLEFVFQTTLVGPNLFLRLFWKSSMRTLELCITWCKETSG